MHVCPRDAHADNFCSSCASQMRMQWAECACSGPTDTQPMASDTSTPSLLLPRKRVLPCESMRIAGEARTRAACVMSVLCMRVLVCKAQRSERGRGSGEAKPGARHGFARHALCARSARNSVATELCLPTELCCQYHGKITRV